MSVVFSFSFMSHYIAHLHAISHYTLVSSVTLMVCFHSLYAHLSFVIFLSHFCIFLVGFVYVLPPLAVFLDVQLPHESRGWLQIQLQHWGSAALVV